MMKTYSELIKLKTFEERYEYLKIGGRVGDLTFGPNRFINQRLYRSQQWKDLKREMIIRDNGCDLAMPDRIVDGRIFINGREVEIHEPVYLHHINPITDEDILEGNDCVFDPENLVCCSFATHEAIHYSNYGMLKGLELVVRKPNDTIPWRK